MACLGFLGNSASYIADANLFAQIAALSLLVAGVYSVRAGKLKNHSRLMKSAIIIQFGTLIVWMGPSLISNIGAFRTVGTGPLLTALHVLGGAFALALAINAAFHRTVIFSELRWTMWMTFIVWSSAAAFGIAFYTYYYLLKP